MAGLPVCSIGELAALSEAQIGTLQFRFRSMTPQRFRIPTLATVVQRAREVIDLYLTAANCAVYRAVSLGANE